MAKNNSPSELPPISPNLVNKASDPLWFKDAIIYELHIKAFNDSNADGIGDFKGLIERLDYLADLGITTIWLLPFYPSPQRDGGYDISDYYSINPDYGTVKQFKKLMKKAHQRGLKVITELVINHTSDQHPWFQRARRAEPGSKYRDYYVWSDTPEKYKEVRIIFQDFETSNWTWDPVAKAYYWHRFYAHQPDLNFDSLQVQEEIIKIMDFWIDMGVDGFRLDAIPYLFERDGTNCENLPETHEFLKKLRAHVDEKQQEVMLLAEANMWPEDSAAYFGDGDECHMNYHFPIMPRMFMALKMEDRYPIIDIINQTPDIPENCQWGIFLRNHDELTLEMVTDEERDYMYRAYNKDASSRINLGIRHRLAPLLDNHRQKIELMNCLLFSLPGTPVIYYGDEIGMGDNVHLGDRDGVRTPMQWSIDRNAGFSKAHPQKLYLPIINDPEYHYSTVNVEIQGNNSSSLLWWMKRLISVRKRYQAFGRGDIKFLSPENAKVLAFTRSYRDEHLLILANLSRHPQLVDLELPGFEHYTPVEVFGKTKFPPIERENNRFTLGPYGFFWFVLKAEDQPELQNGLPELEWAPGNWLQLARDKGAELLAGKVLPSFLNRHKKFIPFGKVLDHVEIERSFPVSFNSSDALLLILKVHFTEGFPERYFLPVAIMEDDPATVADTLHSDHILALLKDDSRQAFLIEASVWPAFQSYLLDRLLSAYGNPNTRFRFVRPSGRNGIERPEPFPVPRPAKFGGNNVPLVFGQHFFMKIFRRLENTPNPELEINRYANNKKLPVPGYLAHFEFGEGLENPYILALLQPYVNNQGSAWQYFLDAARRYLERVQADPKREQMLDSVNETGKAPADIAAEITGEMPMSRAAMLGETLALLHLGMVDEENPALRPEAFSLHYQRSLYSALQSQVRTTFQRLRKVEKTIHGSSRLLEQREQLLALLKRIYHHKMDALKVRLHGDLHLEKVLFTGREFVVFDFEGERVHSFSELRLKKSPVRDLASLICSLYYVAMVAVRKQEEPEKLAESPMLPWARAWFEEMTRSFLGAYRPLARKAGLIPDSEEDWEILMDTFLLDRHLYELEFELKINRGWEEIPLLGILEKL